MPEKKGARLDFDERWEIEDDYCGPIATAFHA